MLLESLPHTPSSVAPLSVRAFGRSEVVRAIVYSASLWLLVCICQAVAMRSAPRAEAFGLILTLVLLANLPYACFCALQYILFLRMGSKLMRVRNILPSLAIASLTFLAILLLYQPALRPIVLGDKPWSYLPRAIAGYPPLLYVFDYLTYLGCFAGVYGLSVRQESLRQGRQKDAVERENLELKLALEQQRIKILQAQLEPHFMFNALNAISALVRTDDRRMALTALSQLSMLLRYALVSSDRAWVQIKDELDFVRDYMGLQSLRFSGRLDFRIEGDDERVMRCVVPPLLLQPLVENVVRHDLERHTGKSNALLRFHISGQCLHIVLSNPDRSALAPNPGCGLGLSHIRDRLHYFYGERAKLDTFVREGRFEVRLAMPIDDDE